jgi:hypothetical protein
VRETLSRAACIDDWEMFPVIPGPGQSEWRRAITYQRAEKGSRLTGSTGAGRTFDHEDKLSPQSMNIHE